MTVAFTKEALDSVGPFLKRVFIPDTKTPFLKLLVHPTGLKVFVINRRIGRRVYKVKIGRFDCLTIEQARKKAREINAQFELGGNPQEAKKKERNKPNLAYLADIYYKNHLLASSKRPNDNRRMLELHVIPELGRKPADEITHHDIKTLYHKIGETTSRYSKQGEHKKSYGNAKRVINVVSAVFNYAIENGLLSGGNPCIGLKKVQNAGGRDRFISFDEMKLFMNALKAERQIFSDLFKILLYTGARKSNVLSMREDDIDFYLKRWRLPAEVTKNGEVNVVLLSQPALKILVARSAFNEFRPTPSPFIFQSERCDGHLKDPKKAFKRVKVSMGVDDLTIHDLRRTFGSYMAINGASLPMIGKALNHKSQASTAIYARLSLDPVSAAVNSAVKLIEGKGQ